MESRNIILRVAKDYVAMVAKNTSDLSRNMTMINMPAFPGGGICAANGAFPILVE